jgi:glycosyltransferase involved in cell wall biosynthesis
MIEISVDARVLSDVNPAGVARYTLSIVNELLSKKIIVRLISNRKIINLPDKKYCNYYITEEYLAFKFIPGTIFIMFILPFINSMKGRLFWGCSHAVPVFNIKSILTIHDLVAFDYPQSMTFINRLATTFSTWISIYTATKITTVSNFTKLKVYQRFKRKLLKSDITVIHNSVDKKFFFINKNRLSKHLNSGVNNYILGVGSIEPRKNLLALIKSFSALKDSGYDGHLVLVGGRSWNSSAIYKEISESKYNKFIKILGYVSDSELNILYNNCSLYVFPSWYEGFGLPALEAVAAGATLLCTINSEIPYLFDYSSNITWFDPKLDNLELKIIEALKNNYKEDIANIPKWDEAANKLIKLADKVNERICT